MRLILMGHTGGDNGIKNWATTAQSGKVEPQVLEGMWEVSPSA